MNDYNELKTKILRTNAIMIDFLLKNDIRNMENARILLSYYIDKAIECRNENNSLVNG